jgi:peptidase E
MSGHIVALGGGGFSMEPDNPRLDRYILSLARRPRPRVSFVGTASGDSADYLLRFYKAFAKLDCEARHLPLFQFDRGLDLRAEVLASDVVYVGGGNTPAMLAVWQLYDLAAAFADLLDAGGVLAGISAGANCWFDRYVTDSVPGGGVKQGLGFAAGTFCPHYDGEAWRRPLVEQVARDHAGDCLACDDSAAVRLDAQGRLVEAVTSVEGKRAHRWTDGEPAPLITRLLA